MKTSAKKKPFMAPYEPPTCEAFALQPTGQILQGSTEDIIGGGPDVPWTDDLDMLQQIISL